MTYTCKSETHIYLCPPYLGAHTHRDKKSCNYWTCWTRVKLTSNRHIFARAKIVKPIVSHLLIRNVNKNLV